MPREAVCRARGCHDLGMVHRRLGPVLAVVIVFCTSAAVLVLEILAGRLLAPYVGVSLETYTGIIGTVLAAIAVGTAAGGRLADRIDPRRLLGPTLVAGGILAWVSLPLLTWMGPTVGRGADSIVVLTAFAFFLPAAVLSAASPMVAKLRLSDLDQTGAVVGGLSAAGTVGALVGTFGTGFVLLAAVPTRPIVLAIGAALVVGGVALWFWFATTMPSALTAGVVLAAVVTTAGTAATASSICQWETAYYCVIIEHDPTDPDGRVLVLDDMRHSHVHLTDPTHLDFRYVRLFSQVADRHGSGPLSVFHVGGGGFTFPRYLDATRPGSTSIVAEIDSDLVAIAEDHLDLRPGDGIVVETVDARGALEDSDDDSFDLVVGDAFGGMSVPWHLTTREVVAEVRRVLSPGGTYVVNVIDRNERRFVRAKAATLADQFDHVVVVFPPVGTLQAANYVLVASDAPLSDLTIDPEDGRIVVGRELDEFVGDARVLTDGFAPVDQLIAR